MILLSNAGACTPHEVPIIAPPPALTVASSTIADADRLDALSKEHEAQRDIEGALDDARGALEIRERLLPPGDVEVARTRLRVARVHWMLGQYPQVDTVIGAAFETLETKLGPDHVDVGRALVLRGNVILHDRQYKAARPSFERALAIFEKATGVDEDIYEAMCDLAVCDYGVQDWPSATEIYNRATALGEKHFGKDDWHMAWAIGGIGEVIRMQGDAPRALPYLERAAALQEKSPYVRQLASALNNVANVYSYTMHDYAKAEPLYRRAIGISEGVYGGEDVNTAQEYMNLGGLLFMKGDFGEGERFYLQGLDVFERKLGVDHPEYVRAKSYLASLRSRKP
jgi:tetratricopeptide (TPR) repeat protein